VTKRQKDPLASRPGGRHTTGAGSTPVEREVVRSGDPHTPAELLPKAREGAEQGPAMREEPAEHADDKL
jgi:hypothetical protein